MNWLHVRRIAWKEMRGTGLLWVLLVALWAIWVAGYSWMNADASRHQIFNAFDVATGMLWTVVLYFIAWGALSYSVEHEERSFVFLQSLPVRAKNVFCGKLTFAVASSLAMLASFALLIGVYAWLVDLARDHSSQLGVGTYDLAFAAALIPLSLLVGMYWSMKVKRPILAIGLAFLLFFCMFLIAGILCGSLFRTRIAENGFPYSMAIGLILGTSAILFAVIRNGARRWLGQSGRIRDGKIQPAFYRSTASGSRFRQYERLFWMQLKRNRWQFFALLVVPLVFLLAGTKDASSYSHSPLEAVLTIPMRLFILAPAILGLAAFRREHTEKRFRLLAQLGTSHRSYWLSCLVIPATLALVVSIAVAIAEWDISTGQLFMALLVSFSIAQFCSMAFPSFILGLGACLVSTIVAIYWFFVSREMGLPLELTYGPVFLAPLLASYWRVPRWFRETGSWKQWIIPALPLVLLCLSPVAGAYYRLVQIPQAKVPLELLVTPSPPDKEGAALYREALAKLPVPDKPNRIRAFATPADLTTPDMLDESTLDVDAWVHENEPAIDNLVNAIRQSKSMHSELQSPFRFDGAEQVLTATNVLRTRARQSQDDGKTDVAWDDYVSALDFARDVNNRYSGSFGAKVAMSLESIIHGDLVHWAMVEETEPPQIFAAAEFLEQYRRSRPSMTHFLAAEYLESIPAFESWSAVNEHVIRGGFRSLSVKPPNRYSSPTLRLLARISPFEISRMRRMNDWDYIGLFKQYRNQKGQGSGRDPNRNHDFYCRGVIYQLVAIAIHKETGEYPTGFGGVKLGNGELPDDPFKPGFGLAILNDQPDSMYEPLPGKFIRSTLHIPVTFSNGKGVMRRFLLPDFEEYSRDHFEKRLKEASNLERNIKAAEAYREGDYQSGGYGGDGDFGGYDPPPVEGVNVAPFGYGQDVADEHIGEYGPDSDAATLTVEQLKELKLTNEQMEELIKEYQRRTSEAGGTDAGTSDLQDDLEVELDEEEDQDEEDEQDAEVEQGQEEDQEQ